MPTTSASAPGFGGPMAKVARRGIRAHRFRLVSTMAAVLLGVSFMTGTAILGDTVEASFDEVFVEVYGRIDVAVRSDRQLGDGLGQGRDAVDAALVAQLAALPGAAGAEGEVEGQLRVLDARGRPMYNPQAGPPALALPWLERPELNRWELAEGRAPERAGEVVLDRRTATEGGYRVGDRAGLVVRAGPTQAEVVGIATYAGLESYSGSPAVLFDPATAQEVAGEPGRFDWISVVAAPGTTPEQLADQARALGLPEVEVVTGAALVAERQELFGEFVTLFTQLIGAFGAVALFVGAFIIYNTFTIIVAQRTRELALLRAVGASRRQVLGSVLTEATLVAVLATAAGLVAGWGVAHLLRTLIRVFGFDLPDTPLVIDPGRFTIPVALGVGVTVLSALVPGWRAARTPPVAAMARAVIDRTTHPWWRLVVGLPFFALAVAVVAHAVQLDSDLAPGVVVLGAVPAIVGLAVAGPVLVPPVVGVLGAPLPPVAGVTGRLAQRNALRHPARTSSTACALVIGISLVCIITVAAASLSATVARTVERTTFGDYVVTTNAGLGMPTSLAGQLAEVPGVAVATGVRAGPVGVGGDRELAIAVDPTVVGEVVDLEVSQGSLGALVPGTVAVAAPTAVRDGLAVGDRVTVTFLSTGAREVEVAAVYDRALTRYGEYLFPHAGWDAAVPPLLRSDWRVMVVPEAGADPDAVREGLEAAVSANPTLEVLDVAEYQDRQAGQVVSRISYLYALLGLALLIGLLGIVNTLLLSVHERTRELGLMRAVGAARGQLSLAVLQEAGVIAALGAVVGVALGVVLGWAMVQTLRFDEEVVFTVPGWSLLAIGLGACAAGVVAGLYPAWRAGRLDVLQAVAYE